MGFWKKVIETINTPAEDATIKKLLPIMYTAVFSVLAMVSAILTILNFLHAYIMMGISTSVLFVGFVIAVILVLCKKRTASVWLVTGLLCFIFTMYAVTGGNYGFAITWILLIPLLTMGVFGIKIGFFTSLYFQLLLFALFFTPLKVYVEQYYTAIFMERFPFVYLAGFCSSVALMYQLQTSRLRLLNHEQELITAVENERKRVSEITFQTILSISNAVDAKDEYTQQHSRRVAAYSAKIAEKLGWEQERIDQIRNIALLHDIGKISIRDGILNKPGKLTEDEYSVMKTHTEQGSKILKDLAILPHVTYGTKYHHERYDGKGYPDNLKEDEIPIEGRIIGLADAFDAMNSNRVYRHQLTAGKILEELKVNSGTQFDPELVEIFLPIAREILLNED